MLSFWLGWGDKTQLQIYLRLWKNLFQNDFLFVILGLIRGYVLSSFGQDFVNCHILVFLISRMVMDMHAKNAGNRIIDRLFDTGCNPVALSNRQFSIDTNRQIHDNMWAKPMCL